MPTVRRLLVTALVVAASLLALGILAGPASASPCGTKVLKDWSDNSRIDRTYKLHCYQDAIDALPIDIRDYSDAEDVIGRALRDAGGRELSLSRQNRSNDRAQVAADTTTGASSPSSVPVPLLVLGGVALALLAAGGYGYVSRRRRIAD